MTNSRMNMQPNRLRATGPFEHALYIDRLEALKLAILSRTTYPQRDA
jgi:hypothetical protein